MLKHYIYQNIVYGTFTCIPQILLDKLYPTQLIVPYYHMVNDDKAQHVYNLYRYKGTRDFQSDLEYLLRHYVPVDLHDLLNTIESNGEYLRRSFHLTFD